MLLEGLQPYRSALAVGGGRPPRLAVVGCERGQRGIDVGRDHVHLTLAEETGDVQKAGLGEEVRQFLVVVGRRERVPEIEGVAVAVAEVDRATRVHGTGVQQRPQDDPPVEEVLEPAARQVEVAAAEKSDRRADVVHQVGDVLVLEANDRGRAIAPGGHRDGVAVERQRPAPTSDLDAQRDRVDGDPVGVASAPKIDRTHRTPSRPWAR